mgnify:CR=1 FL=1
MCGVTVCIPSGAFTFDSVMPRRPRRASRRDEVVARSRMSVAASAPWQRAQPGSARRRSAVSPRRLSGASSLCWRTAASTHWIVWKLRFSRSRRSAERGDEPVRARLRHRGTRRRAARPRRPAAVRRAGAAARQSTSRSASGLRRRQPSHGRHVEEAVEVDAHRGVEARRAGAPATASGGVPARRRSRT